MPKGKGPGAPYGNKNAVGPHKGSSLVVKKGKLVKHPNILPYKTPTHDDLWVRDHRLDDFDKFIRTVNRAVSKGSRQKKSFGKFLTGFYKKNSPLKRVRLTPRPKQSTRSNRKRR